MRNQDSTDDDLMPRDPTRVAVIQHSATTDVDKNLTTLALLSREAAAAGASLITWPEAFAYLGRHEGKRALLESLAAPGPILTFCQDLAREMGTDLLLGGFHEKVAGDPSRCYNTSVYLDHEGHILATYRKIHLFDVDIPDGPRLMESRHTAPGDQAVVVTGKPGVLGLSICYDVRFPALYQRLVSLGAMAITVPSASQCPCRQRYTRCAYPYILRDRQHHPQFAWPVHGSGQALGLWGCRGAKPPPGGFPRIG